MTAKERIHKELHKKLVTLLYNARSGHIGSCLSCLDIITELLVYSMKKGDTFIMSKGHGVPALYVVLNYLGKLSDTELATFHKNATKLPAHPPASLDESVPFPAGSLGHGLSISSGIAQGILLQKKKTSSQPYVFCLMSDGECNEGQVWEAAQYASRFQLANLIVLLDKNRLQALGRIEDVLGDSATREKWEAFGFEVFEADGHNVSEISKVLTHAKESNTLKPKIIIFETIKGHGVSFMEHTVDWHYNVLSEDLYNHAMKDLDKLYES
jgi:transketolase